MSLREVYEELPEHLKKEYSFVDIKNHTFMGLPLLPKIKEWYDKQKEKVTKAGMACCTILASRKQALEFGAKNEEELQKGLNDSVDKVLEMMQMPNEKILEIIRNESMSKDN